MRILLFFLLFHAFRIFGQEMDCTPSAEITVTSAEIQLSSGKYQIKKDSKRNYILFYPEGEKHSFWYKIMVDSDCRFAFKITSADSLKSSKYYLYKNPDIGSFCKELKKKKIIPARSGDFYEEKTSSATIFSSGKKKEEVNFIQPVTASKGEIYYLNIRHNEESDCGHYLNLIVSSEIVSFRATYPNCFEEENSGKEISAGASAVKEQPSSKEENMNLKEKAELIAMKADSASKSSSTLENPERVISTTEKSEEDVKGKNVTEIAISSNEKSPVKRNFTQVTVSGFVLDSITNSPLMAELKWTDELTGKEIIAQTNPNGGYSMVLDEKVIYKLTCSVVGYKEKTTKFIRQNLNSETMIQDFALNSLKPGENFILKHIYFYAGTYAMKSESQPELDKLYSYLASHEKVKIEIQGHTNGEGKVKKQKLTNKKKQEEGWDFHGNEKKLSKYRADAIKSYLLKKGIEESRVTTEGMGATKMLYPEPRNQREREANRRVEVYILSSAADLASVLNAISE